MLRLLIDENLAQRILRGLKLRIPALDAVRVQDTAGSPIFLKRLHRLHPCGTIAPWF